MAYPHLLFPASLGSYALPLTHASLSPSAGQNLFAGASLDDLVRFYVWHTEYVWRMLEGQNEEARIVSIFDCTGTSASSLRGDRLKMMRVS